MLHWRDSQCSFIDVGEHCTSRNQINEKPAGLHRVDTEPEHLLAVFDKLEAPHQFESAVTKAIAHLVRLLGQRPVRDSDHDAAHRPEYIKSVLLSNINEIESVHADLIVVVLWPIQKAEQ
jgi:hypothetical protein